ncbi:MAG: sugar epimerase [Euryarchaeota archaeon]|nr:sugar epimerase [Euryarchaeota archaeon]OUV26936.1 MAG: sugar epimerase [Euryarchaeota archaeon TMED97]
MSLSDKPKFFKRGESSDFRGSLEYYNDLSISSFKRFYIVNNPTKGTVRAWHGHKIEAKLIKVLEGEFIVSLVQIDDWSKPSKDNEVFEYKIDNNSDIIYIPPGFANGAMNTISNSKIMYFSTLELEDSAKDDYRYESKYWDPWSKFSPEIYE